MKRLQSIAVHIAVPILLMMPLLLGFVYMPCIGCGGVAFEDPEDARQFERQMEDSLVDDYIVGLVVLSVIVAMGWQVYASRRGLASDGAADAGEP